jgi:hypothetical protein
VRRLSYPLRPKVVLVPSGIDLEPAAVAVRTLSMDMDVSPSASNLHPVEACEAIAVVNIVIPVLAVHPVPGDAFTADDTRFTAI